MASCLRCKAKRAVERKLESDWSPEQIAGWLKRAYPEDEHYQVSHETLYRSLYVQTRRRRVRREGAPKKLESR
jgi:IS30 family transposase